MEGGINVVGLIVILIFYLLIFAVGIFTWWKRRGIKHDSDDAILAGRSIGPFVGFMTLTATWVGGGYINGSAEAIYENGLIWCQAPFGYAISLILGGLFFAKKMRDAGYVTMLDPLQNLFGRRWGSFLFVPALMGEMLWSASILAALGTTLAVMLNLNPTFSIVISTAIAVSYTLFGGLAAVAYTDVVQLVCIFVGLWLAVPFAITNDAVGSIKETDWVGSIEPGSYVWGQWSDYYILLMFGGLPWQVYFQRVLSARSARQAQVLSVAASFGCMIMVIPACIIGAIAKATDWEQTAFNRTITADEKSLVLPLVIQYLTPTWVGYMGLGAVSAAVMSSADSSVLSSSSMFSRNIYQNVFRPHASDREVMIVMRISVVLVASLSCLIAIYGKSVYTLFYLCGDLVYVMLFPQLTLAVHAPSYVNIYGSVCAYFIGLFIRLMGGESNIGLPATIKFPWYDEVGQVQLFPFRTLAMLVTILSLLLFSKLARILKIDQQTFSFFGTNIKLPKVDGKSSLIAERSLNASRVDGIDNPALHMTDFETRQKNYDRNFENSHVAK